MNPSHLDRELAASLDADPALLPWLPDLLQDLWALGCDPDLVVALLRGAGITRGDHVLDLGCGKGAIAIPLAAKTGATVTGVDLMGAFVDRAQELAVEHGVSDLCTFRQGDMRKLLDEIRDAAAVVYSSVGALGRIDDCVARLRGSIRTGGFLVLDDGFLHDPSKAGRPGYEHYHPRHGGE